MASLPVQKSLAIGLLLGFAIISGGSAVAVPQGNSIRQEELEPITLDDFLNNGALRPSGFSGQWAQGSDNLIRIVKSDSIVDYDVVSGNETIVVYIRNITDNLPEGSAYSGLTFSADGNFALVQHGRSSVWRYSVVARYHIFDLNTREMAGALLPPGAPEMTPLQYVKWSPTGNGIAFVYNYNVYYKADANEQTIPRQITRDGEDEDKAIYNGISDWVYEEEMFGGPNALWISQTNQNLAFIKFNDSEVEMFQWPMYGEPGTDESIYPTYTRIRYPKVGTQNPSADLYFRSLTDSGSADPIKATYVGSSVEDQHIIGTAMWATEDQLLVITLNRVQTVSQWHLCSMTTAVCSRFYTYSLLHGWIDMNTPRVSENGQRFLFVRSVKEDSEPEAYKHIVMVGSTGQAQTVTSGRLSVKSILGWDEIGHKIYFSGTFWNGTHADPSETQIYSISDDLIDRDITCVTCTVLNTFNGTCRENSATFSANFTRFIHRCNGPEVPETTTRFTQDGRSVQNPGPTYINNTNVRDALATKAVPTIREYELEVGNATHSFTARARLYFPVDFDESKKYPLLISVYGGPGSQNIGQGFGLGWETTLVSDKKVIVGYIDGRGTSGSSTDHLFTLHRKLGSVELDDQITVTKHLIDTLSFIDANKTSIWGWSYGGYATTGVLERDTESVFKCGIAVAPVTSWRYYDTIYTERYMALPTVTDNLEGYQNGDLTNMTATAVENLRNKQFMLVHGNADDNVHYQNSMMLARALEQADVFFHQLSYPDENHGINGRGMRLHLYHSLERFLFDECYKVPAVEDPIDEPDIDATTAGSTTIDNLIFMTGITILITMFA